MPVILSFVSSAKQATVRALSATYNAAPAQLRCSMWSNAVSLDVPYYYCCFVVITAVYCVK
jgi:hypothetical protein